MIFFLKYDFKMRDIYSVVKKQFKLTFDVGMYTDDTISSYYKRSCLSRKARYDPVCAHSCIIFRKKRNSWMFKILENWNALYTETKAQSEAIIQISKIISCSFCVSYRVSNSVLFMVYKKTLAQCTDLLLNSILLY